MLRRALAPSRLFSYNKGTCSQAISQQWFLKFRARPRRGANHAVPQFTMACIMTVMLATCGLSAQQRPVATRRGVCCAIVGGAIAAPSTGRAVPTPLTDKVLSVSSLTDEAGNFVVDPSKAAAGLEDPLVEPVGAYSTISAALAVAPAGATVVIKPGRYFERVTIRKPISLRADAGALLVWESDKPYEAALTVDLTSASGAGNVLVAGLAVQHYSPSIAQNYAVFVPPPAAAADGSRIELRYCDISSRSGSGVGVEGGAVDVVGCRVHDCKNHGLAYLGPRARGTVERSSVEACRLNGVLVRDGAAPLLQSNRFNANLRYGAELVDARCDYRRDNEAKGNGKGAVSGECDPEDDFR